MAEYPEGGVTLLILDGWLSIGNNNEHLATAYLSSIGELDSIWAESWRRRAKALSYSENGKTYTSKEASGKVRHYIANLTKVLTGDEHKENKWVIAAYSMGTLVTLVTLGRLLERDHLIREQVALIILVEPAIHGAPYILRFLHEAQSKSNSPQDLEITPDATELGLEGGKLPTEARGAITSLLDAGVAIAVIYCSEDRFVPYNPIDDLRVHHCDQIPEQSLTATNDSETAIDPIFVHLRARTSEDYHRFIYYLSKPLITLL